jgi:hypothetical protein
VHSTPSSSPRTIRGRFAGQHRKYQAAKAAKKAARAAARNARESGARLTLGGSVSQLRFYYDPQSAPQPRRPEFVVPPKKVKAGEARPGFNPLRQQWRQAMREFGLAGGRQLRKLRKRARREGWAS